MSGRPDVRLCLCLSKFIAAPPPVSPPSIREESAEASPRLLAEGFDDKETNLVTEASAGPGDVEGSAAGGGETIETIIALEQLFKTVTSPANLQISAWSLLFLCLLLPLCQVFRILNLKSSKPFTDNFHHHISLHEVVHIIIGSVLIRIVPPGMAVHKIQLLFNF